jgi:DNA-binding MarR family transcriptional regulator
MAGMEHQTTASAERLLRLIHWSSAASRQLRRQLAEVAGAFDLTDNELLIVWLCRGTGRVQFELAAAIGVSPAQMSGVVERLGTRGLVAMHRSTLDRRRQMWQTSSAGRALLDQMAPQLAALAASLSGHLSLAEQDGAEALCQKLAEGAAGRGSETKVEAHGDQDEQHARQEAA